LLAVLKKTKLDFPSERSWEMNRHIEKLRQQCEELLAIPAGKAHRRDGHWKVSAASWAYLLLAEYGKKATLTKNGLWNKLATVLVGGNPDKPSMHNACAAVRRRQQAAASLEPGKMGPS
jgi:hypothetical protein